MVVASFPGRHRPVAGGRPAALVGVAPYNRIAAVSGEKG